MNIYTSEFPNRFIEIKTYISTDIQRTPIMAASSIPGSSFTDDEANFARTFLNGPLQATRFYICHQADVALINFSPTVTNLEDHGKLITVGANTLYIICKQQNFVPEIANLYRIHGDRIFLAEMVEGVHA